MLIHATVRHRLCRTTHDSSMPFTTLGLSPSPFLHLAHVSSVFLFCLYIFLQVSCPLIPTSYTLFFLPSGSDLTTHLPYQPIPNSSVSASLNFIPAAFLTKNKFVVFGLCSPYWRKTNFLFTLLLLLSGDININPGPIASTSFNFANLNIRSCASITLELNKPAVLQEFILDHSIDILFLSETWLTTDSLTSTLNSITPPGYSLIHCPRLDRHGGGLAVIYRSHLKIKRLSIPSFTSFESLCVQLTFSSSSYTFMNIYRPPSLSMPQFISDFSSLLEHFASSPSEIIISGDFNIHIDTPLAPYVSSFLTLLDTFDLQQHVNFPTHTSGHTLDLLISKSSSTLISETDYSNPALSDHYAVLSILSIPIPSRLPRITKFIRSISKVDPVKFSNDILKSVLYTSPASTLDSYLLQFNSTLSSLLDKYAPLKSITCSSRPHKPYITDEILKAKTLRSTLETTYRKSKTPENKLKFKQQAKLITKLITTSRRKYFRDLISSHSTQPKKLWSAMDSLLSRKLPKSLPTYSSASLLASTFLKFFDNKITLLCSTFSNISPSEDFLHPNPSHPPTTLSDFSPASADEVRCAILASSSATCSLDSIPTRLLKSCLDSLVIPITTLINFSLSEATFHPLLKSAIVNPLLKKPVLPHDDLASYRPISNLNFISKILERIIHSRLSDHLQTFPSISSYQSAYRKYHSTETALLRIHNDLLLGINQQKVSALVLLDLSAAFDTIDHNILLNRLTRTFGVTGKALSLLSSYITNRTQSLTINNHLTSPSPLHTRVPQGSVLGPLLFSLYTTPLSFLFKDSPVSFHLYADDTQLYISFTASESAKNLSILSSTLDSVHAWLTANRLSVNPSKTEYLLVGSRQQRSKLISSSLTFRGNVIVPSDTVRNLGVLFDSELSFHNHISRICSSSFYHIRRLRQVRSSLDKNSAIILANALVTSKLDFCNSLFYGLPSASINRLQKVQNALARVVVPSVKRTDHITPTLRDLHWLPVNNRITFKIASITFKTLQSQRPSYLFDLLTLHKPSRNLRSSDLHLLTVPFVKTAFGRRSFSYAAPVIWNSLPLQLRMSTSISSFHRGLKTFLFPP